MYVKEIHCTLFIFILTYLLYCVYTASNMFSSQNVSQHQFSALYDFTSPVQRSNTNSVQSSAIDSPQNTSPAAVFQPSERFVSRNVQLFNTPYNITNTGVGDSTSIQPVQPVISNDQLIDGVYAGDKPDAANWTDRWWNNDERRKWSHDIPNNRNSIMHGILDPTHTLDKQDGHNAQCRMRKFVDIYVCIITLIYYIIQVSYC
jgi:hypothetical protein